MGSLGAKAFERFGICTVVMLIYHVFFGLHTNNMAHLHHKAESTEEI
jgi:APA family basic amino acid/polyamine antiporter